MLDTKERYAIIGDIHGCVNELIDLVTKVLLKDLNVGNKEFNPVTGRRFVFVGDITDRGPQNIAAMIYVKHLCDEFGALIVSGNHDNKFARYLKGNDIRISHGIDKTIDEWKEFKVKHKEVAEEMKEWYMEKILNTTPYLVLDNGRLVVSHAGIKDWMIGKDNKATRSMCLYGDTTGRRDEKGFPILNDWNAEHIGDFLIVHGHNVREKAEVINNVCDVDTGCVFGGKLTALMYPEMEFISEKAHELYFKDEKYDFWLDK